MASAARNVALAVAGTALAMIAGSFFVSDSNLLRLSLVLFSLSMGGLARTTESLRPFQYTAWIITAVIVGLCWPELLLPLNPDDKGRPANKWLMLLNIQLVMFGISTQMRLADFWGVRHMAFGVAVGMLLQFTVMPLTGYALATSLDLPDEVAAGVILIGSCSSGLASNVLTYIARANLPLSITLTAIGSVLAPFITPLWMKWLSGAMVEKLGAMHMMQTIVEIMVLPLAAALLHDFLTGASNTQRRVVGVTAVVSAAYLATLAATALAAGGAPRWAAGSSAARFAGFVAGAVLVGLAYHVAVRRDQRIARLLPIAAMFGIIYYTAVTTAAGRNELLSIGAVLMIAVVVHNTVGYVLGYWLSRAVGLDRQSARTVAIEVGLQNGGMATGIAASMQKVGTLGLAAGVFSPWMNVSGSLLANYWRRRPVEPDVDSDRDLAPGQ